MHLRKLTLTTLLALTLAVQTAALGWNIASDASLTNIVTRALHVTFALYVLIVSVYSVGFSDVYSHWRATIHLSALTTLAFGVLGTAAILPTDESARTVLAALWYTALALYFVTAVITLRTKRGPKLHFPAELIYSAKVIAATTAFAEDNVCGIADASVWDIMLFSYTTKVVMLGYTAASVEIGDLPIVPANMRATAIFARMKAATKHVKLRGRWRPKRGSGWELAYRLLRVNALAFSVQIALAAVSACLFYSPALFLKLLVAYLETDPERKATGWGWVYCAGLFTVNAICYLRTSVFILCWTAGI